MGSVLLELRLLSRQHTGPGQHAGPVTPSSRPGEGVTLPHLPAPFLQTLRGLGGLHSTTVCFTGDRHVEPSSISTSCITLQPTRQPPGCPDPSDSRAHPFTKLPFRHPGLIPLCCVCSRLKETPSSLTPEDSRGARVPPTALLLPHPIPLCSRLYLRQPPTPWSSPFLCMTDTARVLHSLKAPLTEDCVCNLMASITLMKGITTRNRRCQWKNRTSDSTILKSSGCGKLQRRRMTFYFWGYIHSKEFYVFFSHCEALFPQIPDNFWHAGETVLSTSRAKLALVNGTHAHG